MDVDDAAFNSWTQGDLTHVEELLTEEMGYPFHRARALAQRSLVRSRMRRWDMAVEDAKKVILSSPLFLPVLTITCQVY